MSVSFDGFVRLLVEEVRDPTHRQVRAYCSGDVRGPVAEAFLGVVDDASSEDLRRVASYVIDETIFRLIEAIDAGRIELYWRDESGTAIDLAGAADAPHAVYVGADGYRDRFSNEPVYPFVSPK